MISYWNKRKNLFTLFIITKSIMLLILISFIMGLNGWKQNFFVAAMKDQSHDNAKIHLAKAVPSNKPIKEVEMMSKHNNAENRFHSLIIETAYRYDVEPAIIKAIIMAESGFNPKAVSKVGARGLMQLMPRTARSLGVEDSFISRPTIKTLVCAISSTCWISLTERLNWPWQLITPAVIM